MQYSAHESFVAPARAFPQLWRLILGLLVVALVYVACFLVILALLTLTSGLDGAQAWLVRMGQATGPTGTLLLLATFLGMALGPFAAARWLHKRPVISLFGPRQKTLRQFLIAGLISAAIFGLSALIPTNVAVQPNLVPTLWLSYLPLAGRRFGPDRCRRGALPRLSATAACRPICLSSYLDGPSLGAFCHRPL